MIRANIDFLFGHEVIKESISSIDHLFLACVFKSSQKMIEETAIRFDSLKRLFRLL